MAWSYAPLWKLLIDRKMKRTDLLTVAKINSHTIAKMGKGEAISMDAIGRICQSLGCSLDQVVQFVPE